MDLSVDWSVRLQNILKILEIGFVIVFKPQDVALQKRVEEEEVVEGRGKRRKGEDLEKIRFAHWKPLCQILFKRQ